MRTAILLLIALVAIGGVFAWLSLGDDRSPTGGLDRTAADRERSGRTDTTPVEREAAPATRPTAANDAPPTTTPSPTARGESPQSVAPPAANVLLRCVDRTTQAPIAAFRWRLRLTDGLARGDGRAGTAELTVAPDARGELLVEASGYQPATLPTFAATDGPECRVELIPVVTAAGITLLVHDVALAPQPHVLVAAYSLAAANGEPWPLSQPLWSRRASAADGRYVLPTLPPGEYGIRLQAIDGDGKPLPLLPYEQTFALRGDNGFVEDVTLEPGCLLELAFAGPGGLPYDAARDGELVVQLHLPNAPPRPRLWLATRDGQPIAARDAAVSSGALRLDGAVPAGRYVLSIARGDQPAMQHTLDLRSGERQVEQIVVP